MEVEEETMDVKDFPLIKHEDPICNPEEVLIKQELEEENELIQFNNSTLSAGTIYNINGLQIKQELEEENEEINNEQDQTTEDATLRKKLYPTVKYIIKNKKESINEEKLEEIQKTEKINNWRRNLKSKFLIQDLIVDSYKVKGIKNYICSECGKCFTQKSGLQLHVLIHSGTKNFMCNECGKCFVQKGSLITHSLTHKGVRKFSCSKCGKCFTQKGSLNAHMLIHKGIKSFKCNECGKCFTYKTGLHAHILLHKKLKNFQCNECGRCFSRKFTLIMHLKLHSGNNK